MYSLRNPEARRRLAELDAALVDSIADLLETERARRGIETTEPARHVALFIQAFSRGVGIMRAIDPDTIDEPFIGTAIELLARGLVPPDPQAP